MKKILNNQIPEKNGVKVKDKEHYTEEFYQGMSLDSLESARIYLTHLWNFIEPNSVLDVGCGRGAWLKACHELGSNNLYGYDGNPNGAFQYQKILEFPNLKQKIKSLPGKKILFTNGNLLHTLACVKQLSLQRVFHKVSCRELHGLNDGLLSLNKISSGDK